MKAIFNNQIIAESNNTIEFEGSNYFPPESLSKQYFKESTCPWKGEASYYTIDVNGEIRDEAGWYYKNPSEAVKQIKNHVAFWKGVRITE